MVHKTTKFNNVKNFFKKDIHDGSPPSVSFINLFRFSTCKEKIILALGLLASSINGIGATFNALNFCAFSDALIAYGSLNETMQSDKDTLKDAVVRFAINDGLIVVAYLIFKYIALTTFNYAACTQVLRIRGLLFKSALNWDISWYDLHESGELASRINEDLTRLEDGIGEKVPIYFQVIVNFISSVAIAFYYGWELALICIIPAPIVLGSMMFMASNTVKYTKQGINAYAQAGVIAEEVFSAIRTVHAFDGKEKEVERYKINLANAKKVIQKREIFSALLNACQWLFLFAMNALGCWYGVRLIVKQRHWDPEDITYTTGNMLLIFYTMCVSTWHLGMSSMYLETFAAAKASGARVFHLIRQTAIIDPSKNQGIRPTSCLGNISFQNIYFQYPSRPDVKILQGFNLTIERGEVIAMVGHSGCGKSTCIQLIQRFYDPNEGAIYLDGIEIKSLNVNWLRERIGVVGQEPVLFGTTIYENIRYGREDATQEDIEEAAKISNAHHFIKKLPQGYNTLVGERGAQLSGGQKQRIAIARAIVRNPTILLLDEATSALDTKSEAQVQDALERASKGRTTIIVAHRLSTVRNADKIVVIDKGAVVEIGSHNELMLKQNFYYNLITNQLNREIENDEIIKPRLLITDLDDDDEEEVVHNKEQVNEKIAKEPDVSKKKASTLDLLKLHPSDWPYILLGSISAFAFGIMLPLSALFLGGTLGIFSSTDDDYIITRINFFSICWAVAGILIAIGVFFQFYLLGMAGESLTEYIREITFRAMLNQEIAWFDDKSNGTGMLCARLSGDAAAVQQATGTRIGNSLMGLGLVITASVIAIIYNWTMAVIALFCLPVVLGTMWIEKRIRHNENAKKVIALGTSTKLAVEVFSNIRTVVSLGREKLFYNKYMELLNPAAKHQKTNTHIRGISYAISSTASTIAFIPVMGYGGYLTWNDDIFYADAITTARALVLTTIIITNTMAYTPNIERGLTAAANIFALLKRTPKISDTNQIYRNLVCATQGNVDFTSVEFSYPTNPNAQILRGLNLNIAQGQNIALVGSSGCGKSTCIQLLQRFYDVDSGKVTLDGKDIRTTMLRNLRAQLGIVSQEAALFNRTIGENIAYGDNTRKPELFEIIEAAKKANIHNFIASLPLGYDTKVGEKGTQLSGGQKQRIAIARALIRNPKILLLDEATSALDVESEKVVQEALDVAKKGRTCITIAHRLTTIMDVDVIYVFDAGQIVESGSHKELLELKGAYYALHKSQNCHK